MEQENEISFGRVIKVAFLNWKRLLIIMSAVTIASACAFAFAFNRFQGNYSSTFTYSSIDLKKGEYVDGSSFVHTIITSESTLEKVKELDESFSNIDIEKMVKKNDIKISKEATTISSTEKTVEYTYTLTIAIKYFSDSTQAKKFIDKIAYAPIEKDASLVKEDNYNSNLKLFNNSLTFEDALDSLENQANFLSYQYTNLENASSAITSIADANNLEIKSIVGDYVEDDAKQTTNTTSTTTNNTTTQAKTTYTKRENIETLRQNIKENGFVKSYASEYKEQLNNEKESLTAEKVLNELKIADLKALRDPSSTTVSSQIDTELSKLTIRNNEIDNEISVIDKKLANENNTDESFVKAYNSFVSTLNNYKERLSNCVKSYVDFLNKCYINDATISYNDANSVNETGTLSVASIIILSLLLGLASSMVVNLIVDRKQLHD